MDLKRSSQAVWHGSSREGNGTLTSTSKVLDQTPYSFASRFLSKDGKMGTNPEELIAAAHAGCFSMALSSVLTAAGFIPTELKTTAEITVKQASSGFEISAVQLILEGKVPNIPEAKFMELAESAKKNCPVSKALAAVPISLTAKLLK